MRTLVISAVACVVLTSTCAMASAKKKAFAYSPEQVFEAALQSATEHHVVSYVDQAHRMFTFETGHSMSSWAGFKCNVVIEPKDDGKAAEMVLNPQMKESGRQQAFSWGAGGRLADDMFHWTEEKLKAGQVAAKESVGKGSAGSGKLEGIEKGSTALPGNPALLDGIQGILNSLRKVDAAFKVEASQDVISSALIEAQAKLDEFSAESDAKSVSTTLAEMSDSLEGFKRARKNPSPETLEPARNALKRAGELFSALKAEGSGRTGITGKPTSE
jgi:hypothetical protein